MSKVSCRYLSLLEASAYKDVKAYHELVRPPDYDFCLKRDAEYLVIGFVERGGTPWLYVVPADGDFELDVVPAPLFSFDGATIPSDVIVRMTRDTQPGVEIIPRSLSTFDHWYERYIDGERDVVEVIESEVRRLRSKHSLDTAQRNPG